VGGGDGDAVSQLRSARNKGRRTVLRSYGATNHAEFFAVATEAFFEKPQQLRFRKPDLYAILSEFYGVDPAEGMRRIGDGTAASA
jgi:Mlc titration factor MtfA (ptsG expression regulator)